MRQLWRDLERVPERGAARRRPHVALSGAELVRALEEFIAAVDRRLPHGEQADELLIAREAAALRATAADRLAGLLNECAGPEHSSRAPNSAALTVQHGLTDRQTNTAR